MQSVRLPPPYGYVALALASWALAILTDPIIMFLPLTSAAVLFQLIAVVRYGQILVRSAPRARDLLGLILLLGGPSVVYQLEMPVRIVIGAAQLNDAAQVGPPKPPQIDRWCGQGVCWREDGAVVRLTSGMFTNGWMLQRRHGAAPSPSWWRLALPRSSAKPIQLGTGWTLYWLDGW